MPRNPVLEQIPPDPNVFIVGGSVRDWILGLPATDIDLVTNGDAMVLADRIARRHGGRPVSIGRSPFVLVRVMSKRFRFDITPLAQGTIAADLARRDFTINAMALPSVGGPVIDPFGGRDDLAHRRLHPVSETALADDPVRILRAFRLCGQFGLRMSRAARRDIVRHRDRLRQSAAERIRDELEKLLACRNAAEQFRAMQSLGVLPVFMPAVARLNGCPQSPPHHADVFEHSLETMAAMAGGLPRQLLSERTATEHRWLALAALYHDTGKPDTCRPDADGRIRCFGHEAVSARLAADAGERWRLANRDRRLVTTVVGMHMRPVHLFAARQRAPLTRRAIARFCRACGSAVLPVLALAAADAAAKGRMAADRRRDYEAFLSELAAHYQTTYRPAAEAPPLITGTDLLAMGVAPSTAMGRLLDSARRAQIAGIVTDRTSALAWVRRRLPQ